MLTYTENDNEGTNIALGYPVPKPVASLTPVDGFRESPHHRRYAPARDAGLRRQGRHV